MAASDAIDRMGDAPGEEKRREAWWLDGSECAVAPTKLRSYAIALQDKMGGELPTKGQRI